MDEYHRTGGLESFRNQIIRDALEGQKWGLKLMLSSQDLSHFDEEIIRIATALWIMDVGSKEDTIVDISGKVGLSSSAQTIARHQLTGPSEKGTPLLLRLYTKKGDETHFLKFVISPLELWALSTTAEDVTLRQILYDRIGTEQSRRILAQEYPEGTIRKELERRKKQASGQVNDEESTSWLDTIAGELLQKDVKNPMNKGSCSQDAR
jgi:intracellular multiplication protein IcmB